MGFSTLPFLSQPSDFVLRVSGPSGTQYETNIGPTVRVENWQKHSPLLQTEMPFRVAEYSQSHKEKTAVLSITHFEIPMPRVVIKTAFFKIC